MLRTSRFMNVKTNMNAGTSRFMKARNKDKYQE